MPIKTHGMQVELDLSKTDEHSLAATTLVELSEKELEGVVGGANSAGTNIMVSGHEGGNDQPNS